MARPHSQEPSPPSRKKQWIQIFVLVSVIVLCLAVWWDHRYGMWSLQVPDVDVDSHAAEAGIAFSDWRWESRFQLHCKMVCSSDDFMVYEVRYVAYGADGGKVHDGHVIYKPLHAGDRGEGMIDFGVERGKVQKLQLVLLKTTG
jgi:hypothetical protein